MQTDQQLSGSYLIQTKKAIAARSASFGILVTLASKKGTAAFWVDGDVIVVHLLGLFTWLGCFGRACLDTYASRISTQEADCRATALIEYVKRDEFRNLVGDTIFRALDLYKMLKKELNSHRKT